MKEMLEKLGGTAFPDLIKGLPEADIPFEGVKGWILQGENSQAVFFDIDSVGEVPAHSHGDQWGMVIEGEMKLTIDGQEKTYRKGDWYFIPAGISHSATFPVRVHVLDVFADADRWKPKA